MEPKKVVFEVNEHFKDYILDWDHRTYVLFGGYGSSKSYHTAAKILLKCSQEKRKVLVVREVYETIRESCFALLREVAVALGFDSKIVKFTKSPMKATFTNGSEIIFKGMDDPDKMKSIHDISIIWMEEAAELKYKGYQELRGRARHPNLSIHFFVTFNPAPKTNWVYRVFFLMSNISDFDVYEQRIISNNGIYYHHSIVDDNAFLPQSYIDELEDIRNYDEDLWRVARLGRFGTHGTRVLPQFQIAMTHREVMVQVAKIPERLKFNGFDFGFETSFNAGVRLAVDDENKDLYIYEDYYKNKTTDDVTADELLELGYDQILYRADSSAPETITYYNKRGLRFQACTNRYPGSRLENTRKIKRFRKIICSPRCLSVIRELKDLTFKEDKQGNLIFDEFNIDPHTFSAIWYALDSYHVADLKDHKHNTRKGEVAA